MLLSRRSLEKRERKVNAIIKTIAGDKREKRGDNKSRICCYYQLETIAGETRERKGGENGDKREKRGDNK